LCGVSLRAPVPTSYRDVVIIVVLVLTLVNSIGLIALLLHGAAQARRRADARDGIRR
jgi:hypothetical protein